MTAWRLPAPLFFIVHLNISMTTSVPNSFNPEELAKMLKDAPKEAELGRNDSDRPDTYHDRSQETVERIASEAIDYASERCSGPMVHKVMAALIMSNMIDWHSRMHGIILMTRTVVKTVLLAGLVILANFRLLWISCLKSIWVMTISSPLLTDVTRLYKFCLRYRAPTGAFLPYCSIFTPSMTVMTAWSRIRDFSRYEINADGVVRIRHNQREPYYRDNGGKIMSLMSPDGPHPFYQLVSDTQGLCAITRDKLLEFALDRTD